ncbi:MAG: hypothetical protein IPH88_06660 [Bacteroidales bacterium]|nr:hypothetical protein [Bacteroidales bacterium]
MSDRIMDAHVTQSVFFGKAIANYAAGDSTPGLKQKLVHRLNQYHDLYKYEQAIVALPDGRPILSTNDNFIALDSATSKELRNKSNTIESSYSDIYFSEYYKKFQLDIFAPVIIDNVIKAWLILQIDPETFLFPLIQTWPTPSKSAETVLVRKDGNEVLFINELRHKNNEPLSFRIPISDSSVAGASHPRQDRHN